jgi:hypothetical protein
LKKGYPIRDNQPDYIIAPAIKIFSLSAVNPKKTGAKHQASLSSRQTNYLTATRLFFFVIDRNEVLISFRFIHSKIFL